MTSEVLRQTDRIDTVLDALLQHEPPPHVVAIDACGRFVPMPPLVPVRDGCVIERLTPVQLVISADIQVVIQTWERALRYGAATDTVHLRENPADHVSLYLVDARHRYGVLLGFIDALCLVSDASSDVEPTIRPRVWQSRKDERSTIIDVAGPVSEILGWSPEEMIGRRGIEFVHPDDQSRAVASWMDMLSGPGAVRRVRLRYQHRDGSWIQCEVTDYNGLNDPAHRCVYSEMFDVSAEMAAREALRASEEALRRLTEALSVGIVQIDASGRVVYRNERLSTVLGNELAATIDEQFSGLVETDREALTAALHAVLREGSDGDIEVSLSGVGERRRCSISLRALTSGTGAPNGAIICLSEVVRCTCGARS